MGRMEALIVAALVGLFIDVLFFFLLPLLAPFTRKHVVYSLLLQSFQI